MFFLKPLLKNALQGQQNPLPASVPSAGTAGSAGGAEDSARGAKPRRAGGVARPFYPMPGFRRSNPKIPGRQGLARWEPRCCLCPAAVITPPNLESSGRAACSAAIRRLSNCGALVYCFPLRGCSCQQPAEHQHCKPRHRGSSAHVPEHWHCGAARGQGGQGPWHPKSDPSHVYGSSRAGRCIRPGKEPPKCVSADGRFFLGAANVALSPGLPFSCPRHAACPQKRRGMISPRQP